MTTERLHGILLVIDEDNKAHTRTVLLPLVQEALNEFCADKPEIDYVHISAENYRIVDKNEKTLKNMELPDVLGDMLFELSEVMCGAKIYNTNGK